MERTSSRSMALDDGFDGLYGLELTELDATSWCAGASPSATSSSSPPGSSTAASTRRSPSAWRPRDRAGGVGDGKLATGLSNQTSFLRPITEGTIHAVGDPPPPRPHDLGVGGRDLDDAGPAVRAVARDDRRRRTGQPGPALLADPGATGRRAPRPSQNWMNVRSCGSLAAATRDHVRPGQAEQPAGPGTAGQDHRLAGGGQRRGERRRQRQRRAPAARAGACRRPYMTTTLPCSSACSS